MSLNWYRELKGIDYTPLFPDGYITFRNGYAPNSYYAETTTVSVSTVAANLIYATPICIYKTQAFDALSVNVTAFAAGLCTMGIALSNGGVPGQLISLCGEVNTGVSNGGRTALFTRGILTLPPDIYWLLSTFSGIPTVSAISNNTHLSSMVPNTAHSLNQSGLRYTNTYPTIPLDFTGVSYSINFATPNISIKTAS